MSAVALSSDLSYHFPVHSSSVWRGTDGEWEVPSSSGLIAAGSSAENIGKSAVLSSVAQSIADFERLLQQAMVDFRWIVVETQAVPTELDIEREVIAHLPPKHVFKTTLRVRYAGRARPNITLELVDDDL